MKHIELKTLDDDKLVQIFAESAREMGAAVLDSATSTATRAFRRIKLLINY